MAMRIVALESGEFIFYAVIVWLSLVSLAIFASFGDGDNAAAYRRSKMDGGGRCGCGGCRGGVGVCDTYLS
ncbi:hypothetical protein KSP40_PGU002893 [Platanthera guangdongensis]|uniref:Uncharacterized protein n=1 Tax=Platanthera guangdongensis TaxID=2320717 RepID=A0ABR2LGR5_9ASPA